MATDAQRSYIHRLVGDGITVRGHHFTSGDQLDRIISRLDVAPASAMIDELKSVGAGQVRHESATFGSPTRCHFCGGTWAVTKVSDMSGITGYACGHHSRDFAEGLGCFA